MKPLPYRIRADLFLQLSRLEAAGIPYDRAVATIGLAPPASHRLKSMRALAAKGIDAAKAGEQSGLFTALEARLVRAALNAGSPAAIYTRLAEHYTHRARQWSLIKSRLTLPAFVLGIALFVQPLPALVSGAIGLGGYAWQVVAPVLVIAAVVALMRLLAMHSGASRGKSFYQFVPMYGPVFVRTNLRDFFESLAMMLEAGVPMLDALPPAIETVSDGDIRQQLTRVRQAMGSGSTFAKALNGVPYLRGSTVLAFANTGEQSGTLPEMLLRYAATETDDIGRFYEQLAAWVPRIVYALVAVKIVAGIFSGGGVAPRVPADL